MRVRKSRQETAISANLLRCVKSSRTVELHTARTFGGYHHMMDEERLRVTNSVNVSTALTWFAVLLITGAVSGIITIVARFITIGDKVTLEFSTSTWVFIIVITVAIYSLTLSIVFGGLGISAT